MCLRQFCSSKKGLRNGIFTKSITLQQVTLKGQMLFFFKLTYSKTDFLVCSSTNFNSCMELCNYHPKQDTDQFQNLKKLSGDTPL